MSLVWLYNPLALPYQPLKGIIYKEITSLQALEVDYYLQITAAGDYQLCDKQQRHKPLTIDFSRPYYRFRGGTEWLPKALKGLSGGKVADVTAGWGRDSWLLAYRGFEVTMYERNPYLQVLLKQGLDRAQNDTTLAEVANRLSLQFGDANLLLIDNKTDKSIAAYDVIYLDPMYPNKRKKAKVKKDMQALQQLLGGDEQDGGLLLSTALKLANKRVVVKRPKGALSIDARTPSFSIDAPNTRFDVYICQ